MVVLTVMSNLCFENGFCADTCLMLFYVFAMGKEKNEMVNFSSRVSATVQHEGLVLSAGQSVMFCQLLGTSALSSVARDAPAWPGWVTLPLNQHLEQNWA